MSWEKLPEFLLRSYSPHFLRQLSDHGGGIYFSIENLIDHSCDCPTDDFIMRSALLHEEDDEKDIVLVGLHLLSLMNGAGRLMDKDFSVIELDRLVINNQRHQFSIVDISDDLDFLPVLKQSKDLSGFVESEDRPIDCRLFLLEKSLDDPSLLLLLRYFSMENNWVTYNRILETVEYCVSSELESVNSNTVIDSGKKSNFNNSANNFSIVGLQARHGNKGIGKHNKSAKMTLEDAHEFIREITLGYIRLKYPEFGNRE